MVGLTEQGMYALGSNNQFNYDAKRSRLLTE
jgi:hypothetical protein